jgi:hypothetical protein
MEERAKEHVSLPLPNPTTSYWQDPPDEIANLRSTKHLPGHVDYIIIGSGISGASIAYNLIKKKPNSSILMLEARQACSGATGRNGKIDCALEALGTSTTSSVALQSIITSCRESKEI